MGQFKPMVKMYTDEPSVILKLKKGGKVKAHADGFKSMHSTSGGNPFDEAEHGKAPKKPPMAQRMKAMNPNLYAKGGNVEGKQMGGMMAPPMAPRARPARPMAAPVNPMTRAALGAMAPDQRAARAAMVRKALTGMKKGGSTAECAKLERELKHHEALSASKAHGKASGGAIDAAETKTTLKPGVKPFAKTKVVDGDKTDKAKGTGEVKMGKPAGYKHGGKMVHKAMGGSIMGNEGPYEKTKMVSAGKGKSGGTTGGVRMGNGGGYKKGGVAKKAVGGEVQMSSPSRSAPLPQPSPPIPPDPMPPGRESPADVQPRPVDESYYYQMRGMPGPVVRPQIGGPRIQRMYAKGGVAKKANGGTIKAAEIRPANTSKPGKTNTTTGAVKLGNAGGYKHGGSLGKAYATGGNVVDDGKAEKMPRRPVHPPVANSLQSGTYKRGGKVHKAAGGDIPDEAKIQAQVDANERALKAWEQSQKEEAESTRNLLPNLARRAVGAVKGMFGSKPPPGSVTKTEKSVTVAPGASAVARKRGGKC